MGTVPNRADHDSFWHLKTGRYISENGIPEHDPFSFTAADREWNNHEWLAEVAFYKVWQAGEASGLGGYRALVLGVSACLWATYAILLWLAMRLTRNAWLSLLIVIFAIAVGRRTFYPRPPVISYVFLAALIAFFTAYSEGWITRRRWLIALLPLIALWTNLHAGWMAGFIVLAAFGSQDIAELLRRKIALPFEIAPEVIPFMKWVALAVGVVVASCCNPFGWKLYELPTRVMGDAALVRSIFELRSPDFFFVQHFEGVIVIVTVLGLLCTRFRPRVGELLIYLFFFHQGIQHVRHLTLFGIAMVPLLARLAAAAWDAANEALDAHPRTRLAAHAGLVLATLVAANVLLANPREGQSYPARNLQFLRGEGYVRAAFPAAQSDFVELAKLEGRMFNHNTYAGYLIWRFSPEKHLVFSDPRFDIFGGHLLEHEGAIFEGLDFISSDFEPMAPPPSAPAWSRLLDRYEIQWMLIPGDCGLGARLPGSKEWTLAAHWRAPGALARAGWQIWIRNSEKNAAMIQRAHDAAVSMEVAPR